MHDGFRPAFTIASIITLFIFSPFIA